MDGRGLDDYKATDYKYRCGVDVTYVTLHAVAIGKSNRIVIDAPTDLKRRLYAALTGDGLTLRDWFVRTAEDFLRRREQQPLPFIADSKAAAKEHGTDDGIA